MKNSIILLSSLLLSTAANAGNSTASFNYSCTTPDGQVQKGQVSIDENQVVGEPSCLYFQHTHSMGLNALCWRFERQGTVNNIFLVQRKATDLNSTSLEDPKVVSMDNIPYAENAKIGFKVKKDLFSSEQVECTMTDVQWVHAQ